MTSKVTNKNHFNPKGHLKGFTDNSKLLTRYRKDKQIFDKPKHYKSFGWKTNLYPQSMEDILEKFDSSLPVIVAKLQSFLLNNDKSKTIQVAEIHTLARFIIFQLSRISKFKNQLDKHADIIKKKSELYQNVPDTHPMYDAMHTSGAWLEMAIYMNNELVEDILKHSWVILIADKDSEFILADSGLATGTHNLKDNPRGLGLGSPDTLKMFPLSRKLCLLITSDGKGWYEKRDGVAGINSLPYTKEKVNHINGLIASCADEFIYASNKEVIKEALTEADRILQNTGQELKNLLIEK
jgi:hypothetical protein